jgi:hypothetical protein
VAAPSARLSAPARQLGGLALPAAAAAAAAVGAAVAVDRPALALALPAAVIAFVLLTWVDPRVLVCGVLLFLPVQDLVLTHATGPLIPLVRYGPELVLDLYLLGILLARGPSVLRRLGPVAVPLGALLMFWVVGGVWNRSGVEEILVGIRAEVRFLPLLVIPFLASDVRSDARLYARCIVGAASLQALVAVAEFLGGVPVRRAFAPQYDISIAGIDVGKASPPLEHIFGTFAQRNLLGVFLALAWLVVAAAGARGLGISRRAAFAVGTLLVIGVGLSGSREGALALGAGALVIAAMRFGSALLRPFAVALAALALVGFATVPEGSTAAQFVDSNSLTQRWQALFSGAVWSPDTNFRLKLLEENAKLAAADEPVFGFGIGTASDPRLISNFTSPVYRSFPGLEKAVQPFVSDGNWAILVAETGFVGLALLAVLLLALVRLGLSTPHWSGGALVATVAAVAVLGFFASVLQQRPTSAILWLLAGLAGATTAYERARAV